MACSQIQNKIDNRQGIGHREVKAVDPMDSEIKVASVIGDEASDQRNKPRLDDIENGESHED